MRQISIDAATALFANRKFKRDNTEVVPSTDKTYVHGMYLFGNRIAFIDVHGLLNISTARFPTRTTAERLSALGVDVHYRKSGVLKLYGLDWGGEWTTINNIRVEAHGYETRNGWGHKSELFVNGGLYASAKIRYYNRTWEAYRFKSVKQSVVRKAINKAKKDNDALLVAQLESFYKTL